MAAEGSFSPSEAAAALRIKLPEDAAARLTAAIKGYTEAVARNDQSELVVAMDAESKEPTAETFLKLKPPGQLRRWTVPSDERRRRNATRTQPRVVPTRATN